MNTAQRLQQEIGKARAWSLPPEYSQNLAARVKNQHGTAYRFADGSRVFVAKGTARIEVRP